MKHGARRWPGHEPPASRGPRTEGGPRWSTWTGLSCQSWPERLRRRFLQLCCINICNSVAITRWLGVRTYAVQGVASNPPVDLPRIRPSVEMVVRALPSSIGPGLAAWGAGQPFEIAGQVETFFAALQDAFETAPPLKRPRLAIYEWLVDDIRGVLAWFVERTSAPTPPPTLRFSVGMTPQCRKFHVDFVAARAICAYHGPGTLWVEDAQVDRTALARLIPCHRAANAAIVPDPTAIRQARPGDLLLLRGANHPSKAAGAVHRSPDASELPSEGRVLLTITSTGVTL